ncbi:hypothetical protein RKE38_06955 [Phycicoccus sp. M110.8]|uniref:hypothetical protein n=1 Tax=Phycicoccus sp. M110.8 TaxID=3075433 RepID=UPI0028FCFE67|nr:hypothetical protein [Phycicoccus sp. M110.8]MDU0313419.1 hypothetical protein [Phycicoccus sp. M110.8]
MSAKGWLDRAPGDRWLVLQPPAWVPFAWWALLLGSVIASAVGEPVTVCTVAQPCQPDGVFPVVVALAGIAASVVWWEPATALVAGLAYGALAAAFDPSTPGRCAGLVLACASAGGLAALRAIRARQAQVADDAAAAAPVTVGFAPAGEEIRPRRWVSWWVPAVGVAGLLLVGGAVAGYVAQTTAEEAHVARAERTDARVVSLTGQDYRRVFELQDGPRAGQRVRVEVAEELDLDGDWVVLLDPQDPSWARLASEPKGYTYWFGWVALGGFAVAWSAVRAGSGLRDTRRPRTVAAHWVRITPKGRADLALAGSTRPVATVSLAGAAGAPGGAAEPALVSGRVAPGSWVAITTREGPLPVSGPLQARYRWRPLDFRSPEVHPRVAAAADRGAAVLPVLRQLFSLGLGVLVLSFALGDVGPAWHAAHGKGTAGSLTVTSVSCGGKGPCHHYGSWRSSDGAQSLTDVEIVGASADVGQSLPAYYEGDDEVVFAPGWTGLVESSFYLAIGAGFLLAPFGGLLGAFLLRRHPPTGRHARGRRSGG